MKRIKIIAWILIIAVSIATGCTAPNSPESTREWRMVESSAQKTMVNFYGWGGDENANAWFDEVLKPYLEENYNIHLKRVAMNYDSIFELMQKEKENKVAKGSIDILWISGRNFEYAKNNGYLFGPFVSKVPNYANFINKKDPETEYDKGFPIEGYSVPFGKRQLTLFYNEDVIYDPPTSLSGLMEIIKANPGQFTYPVPDDPAGIAFIETVIYETVGYKTVSQLKPDRASVETALSPALYYLKQMEPYLWEKGDQYPSNEGQLDRLFRDEKLVMAMSWDSNHATRMLAEDNYNLGAKPFVFLKGTAGSTHYLAIPWNSPNKSGAMVVINTCLSVDMQANKLRTTGWGDLPSLDIQSLPTADIRKLQKSVMKKTTPKLEMLLQHRVPQLSEDLRSIIKDLWYEQIAR